MTNKLQQFLKRNARLNSHLYSSESIEGIDYVVCPVSQARISMIKSTHIERNLGLSVSEFHDLYPNTQMVCDRRKTNIAMGLAKTDETGLSAHARSVMTSKKTKAAIAEDGSSIDKRKGQKTRSTHLSRIDQDGNNGYKRIANQRNNTILANGLSVQQNARIKGYKKKAQDHTRSTSTRASKSSKVDLEPLIDFLVQCGVSFYFDNKQYGIWDEVTQRYYLYDLVIPDLSLAIEYHGSAFHPDQNMSTSQWLCWRQLFTGKTADEVRMQDNAKQRALYHNRGFATWEIYQKDAAAQVQILLEFISSAQLEQTYDFTENNRYEVETSNGWSDFAGILRKPSSDLVKIEFASGRCITVTPSHVFFIDGKKVETRFLFKGDLIDGAQSPIKTISKVSEGIVYDLVEVDNEQHSFLINDNIVTKNCDEFAFVNPNTAKEFWKAVQPVISTGGGCIITSTPKSDTDQFAQIWRQACDNKDANGNPLPHGRGRNDFFPVKAIWSDNPERDEAWAKPFRESLGDAGFRQEMCAEFVTDDETLINPLTLSHMQGVKPLFFVDESRWYIDPAPNHTYLIALDPALGTQNDAAAIQIWMVPGMVQVAEWQSSAANPREQMRTFLRMLWFLSDELESNPHQIGEPQIFWTVENNSLGESNLQLIEDIGEENFPGTMINERRRKGTSKRFRKGLNTNTQTKKAACAQFKNLVEGGRTQIFSENLVIEMKNYVRAAAGIFKAKPGMHDDLVSATLLCVRLVQLVRHQGIDVGPDISSAFSDDEIFGDPLPVVI